MDQFENLFAQYLIAERCSPTRNPRLASSNIPIAHGLI
jgi:hypothetical protein